MPTKSTFNVVTRIEQVLELVSARASQQRVALKSHLPAIPLLINADAGQIQQVLLNLLINAVDALPDGGVIEVSAEPVQIDDQDWIMLEIADNGTGMTTELLARLFEPFTTTKETGTGLGLSICRQFIEAHGGVIEAENRATGGARFLVQLPVGQIESSALQRNSIAICGEEA